MKCWHCNNRVDQFIFHFPNYSAINHQSPISMAHVHWPSHYYIKKSDQFMLHYHIHVALNHRTAWFSFIYNIVIVKPDKFTFHCQSYVVLYQKLESLNSIAIVINLIDSYHTPFLKPFLAYRKANYYFKTRK